MNTLFVIIGPTGIGKTDISVRLARHLRCSIISCDSRQIFKELRIGTAAPSDALQKEVKHYFVGTKSITEHYSAGQYEVDAVPIIKEEINLNGNALMVGGSMLYVDAVCKGIDDIPTIDPQVRREVSDLYEHDGIEGVRRRLKLLDPVHYGEVDLMNVKRMLHAIEVCVMTGKTFSEIRTNPNKKRPFKIVKIGLERTREELYDRINGRVLQMIVDGLEDEAREYYEYRHLNSLNTVGYKEMFEYIDGRRTLESTIEKIQQNTRHYAKKQISWFNKDVDTKWFHPEHETDIIKYINECNA